MVINLNLELPRSSTTSQGNGQVAASEPVAEVPVSPQGADDFMAKKDDNMMPKLVNMCKHNYGIHRHYGTHNTMVITHKHYGL
jgi:hypothetical protein